ncbi:hypothetical protein BJ742DRAFT_46586 [Cladochytrium replicatum]|nr:hypothetical protein BJ742DRAFT_46586 [Cladochytrium replicatum]
MYHNLRTNLTPELMAFPDFPFPPGTSAFPEHTQILEYLEEFAIKYDLLSYVRFDTTVESAVWDDDTREWIVTSVSPEGRLVERYDGVVSANGHYWTLNVPKINGMESFPGRMVHSHDYRMPEPFTGKRVVVIGGGSSGIDIGRQIAAVAAETFLSLKDVDSVGDLGESLDVLGIAALGTSLANGEPINPTPQSRVKIVKKPAIVQMYSDSSLVFEDGSKAESIDVVLFATGYLYDFPFLSELSGRPLQQGQSARVPLDRAIVTDGAGVRNLYKWLFYIPNPTLAFIGLPYRICPFPLFALQSQFISLVFKGARTLPDESSMREDAAKEGEPGSKESMILGYVKQYPHFDWISELVSGKPIVDPERIAQRESLLVLRRKYFGY